MLNLIEALKVAHKADVYHRELNPENIFLSGGLATLAQFGKAYLADRGEMGYTVAPPSTVYFCFCAPELRQKMPLAPAPYIPWEYLSMVLSAMPPLNRHMSLIKWEAAFQ